MTARNRTLLGGGVVLGLLALGSLAARAPLWNDELFTWYIARLPGMGEVWDVLDTGVEQLPPAYYAVERASLAVLGENRIALRAPSLVGFLLACTCLFVVVSRRTTPVYGVVAALIPLASGAATYAWEARPYALVLGFAGAAVLCHQLRADSVAPRLAAVGLAVCLAGATAMHYYGALVVLPIALAELVRRRLRGRLDRAVALALLAPLVPLAASSPLLESARRYRGAFWTEFDLGSAPEFFVYLLRAEVFSASRIPTWLGIAFAAVVVGVSLVVLLRRPRVAQVEVATGVGFLLLPLVGVLVGELATGAYVERYVLSAVLGPALLVPLALHRAGRGSARVAVVASTVLALWSVVLLQYWHRDVGVDLDRRDRLVAFVAAQSGTDLPVAVAHPHDYLELAHAAPSHVASRLVRLSDPERAERYTGSRSTEDGIAVLAGFAPLSVVPYDSQRREFLLLRTVRGAEDDWIESALADDEAGMRVVAEDPADGFALVLVSPAGP